MALRGHPRNHRFQGRIWRVPGRSRVGICHPERSEGPALSGTIPESLLTLRVLMNDRQERTFLSLSLGARFLAGFRRITHDVSYGSALQYLVRGILHLQENTIERAIIGIVDD